MSKEQAEKALEVVSDDAVIEAEVETNEEVEALEPKQAKVTVAIEGKELSVNSTVNLVGTIHLLSEALNQSINNFTSSLAEQMLAGNEEGE